MQGSFTLNNLSSSGAMEGHEAIETKSKMNLMREILSSHNSDRVTLTCPSHANMENIYTLTDNDRDKCI